MESSLNSFQVQWQQGKSSKQLENTQGFVYVSWMDGGGNYTLLLFVAIKPEFLVTLFLHSKAYRSNSTDQGIQAYCHLKR